MQISRAMYILITSLRDNLSLTNARKKVNDENGLLSKNDLISYFKKSVKKGSSMNNTGTNNYIEINGKIFFVNHVIEILNNDVHYTIDQKRNIIRDVYKYKNCEGANMYSLGKYRKKNYNSDFKVKK